MKAYKDYEDWNSSGVWNDELESENTARNWREVWRQSRVGMIPESEAVRVPPVSEWPEDAVEIRAVFIDRHGIASSRFPLIATIPRPVPTWTPKVEEAVFALQPGKTIPYIGWVCVVNDSEKYAYTVRCHDGECYMWRLENLKPFDASKIGKPWEEI